MLRRAWIGLTAVLVVAIAIGSWRADSGPRTADQRVDRLTAEIRCPTCAGLSVAESDTPLARAARDDITRRVSEGQADDAIRDFYVSRYGSSALMSPKKTGIAAVAWGFPVFLGVVALVGMIYCVRRWRRGQRSTPSDEDRRLVEEALGQP